ALNNLYYSYIFICYSCFFSIKLTYTNSILNFIIDVNKFLQKSLIINYIDCEEYFMTVFDRVKELAKKQGISIVELEEKLGFGRNSLYSWKKKTPNGDRLSKVADYFGVTTDYLLGRTETPQFTSKDERDIQKKLTEMIDGLSDDSSLAYLNNGGTEIDEEDAELIRSALERTLRRSKLLAKEKFTPKKYRK